MNRDGTIESPWRVDDTRDDAALAYKEVMERSFQDEPSEPAPEREPARAPAAKEPDGADTKGDGDRARDPVTKRFVKGTPPAKETPLHPDPTGATAKTKTAEKKPAEVETPETVVDPNAAAPVKAAPPPSFSIKTKADWDKLPEHVRADIVKREGEMQQGLAALRDYKDLKPYADLARQHNTTIGSALKGYIDIENLLKSDLPRGLAQIVQNFGHDQKKAAQIFADLATKFGGQVQTGHNNGQQEPEADPLAEMLNPILAPIVNQLGELKTAYTSRAEADRNAQVQSLAQEIEKFAADPANKFWPDLEETVTQLFEKGMVPTTGNHAADLKAAYEMAARMNPQVHEALIEQRLTDAETAKRQREQDAAAKARNASRSMSGSRIPGTVTRDRADDDDSSDDVEADVRRAFRLHANG